MVDGKPLEDRLKQTGSQSYVERIEKVLNDYVANADATFLPYISQKAESKRVEDPAIRYDYIWFKTTYKKKRKASKYIKTIFDWLEKTKGIDKALVRKAKAIDGHFRSDPGGSLNYFLSTYADITPNHYSNRTSARRKTDEIPEILEAYVKTKRGTFKAYLQTTLIKEDKKEKHGYAWVYRRFYTQSEKGYADIFDWLRQELPEYIKLVNRVEQLDKERQHSS